MLKSKRKKIIGNFGMYLLLIVVCIISLYPFYWMFIGSTLTSSEIFQFPPRLLPGSSFWDNITNLVTSTPIFSGLKNSLITTVGFTVLNVYFCSLAGYAFAKFEFKGKNILFYLITITMMLPQQVTLIPLFKTFTSLNLQNNPLAVIFPALANAFGVFFMRQNMMSIPMEMIEAARVDGANEFKIFNRIILPTLKPAIASLALLNFINQWGNYLWPLIILQDTDAQTLPVMLSMLIAPGQVIEYGQVLAGTIIGVLPILIIFIFCQKYFVAGIYGGSVKG